MESSPSPKKLLAINFGGLGDEVLFLPTLQSIKSARPLWHITLLTEPRARSIMQVTNVIDDNVVFDIKKKPLKPADYLQLISLLRAGNYDAVISSGASPQVAGLLFLSGIGTRIGYGTNALARALLTKTVPLNKNQHAAFMYHDLVGGLGIDDQAQRPQVTVDTTELTAMRQLIQPLSASTTGSAKIVLVHPGTSKLAIDKGVIKTWAAERWAQLIARLLELPDVAVVLAGGPDDDAVVQKVLSELSAKHPAVANSPRFLLAHGKTKSLPQLVALLELSNVVACVDSAPMHLAVGLNKPTVALFGPTDPSKLLWPDSRFIALRDPIAAQRWAHEDPFAHAWKIPESERTELEIDVATVFDAITERLAHD